MKPIIEYSNQTFQREGSPLVLMLHGYGSQERDLMQIGQMIGGSITWAGMRAPQPVGLGLAADAVSAEIPGTALGYQWFPLDQNLSADMHAIELAADYVIDFLGSVADTYSSISLLGFSQGMAVATTVARVCPELLSSVMGLSGYVVEGKSPLFKDRTLAEARLPFFYGRGDADQVIPQAKVDFTQGWLPRHGVVTTRVYAGMQHGICPEEISHLADFVQENIL